MSKLKNPNVTRECINCGTVTMRHRVLQTACTQCGGTDFLESEQEKTPSWIRAAGKLRRIKSLPGQISLFDKHEDTGQ